MKKIHIILLLLIFSFPASQAKTFKIATSAPNGSYWMKQMRKSASEIRKQTEGRVKFKFYPGGVMGSRSIVLKKMRIRQLDGAAISDGGLADFYPQTQLYSLPMLFNDYKEVDYIRRIYDGKIINGLEQAGIISFGLSEAGFSYAMSTQQIKNTDDLKKRKIWAPENNKQAELTLKAFDITPIPLNAGDVLAGLQTNLIDTVAASPIIAIALQWHTQIKYITDIPLTYIYATMIINKKSFDKISESDQAVVRQIMQETFRKIDKKNRQDNVSAFNALLKQGIKLVKPDREERQQWYAKGASARQKIRKHTTIPEADINQLQSLLKEYRSSK